MLLSSGLDVAQVLLAKQSIEGEKVHHLVCLSRDEGVPKEQCVVVVVVVVVVAANLSQPYSNALSPTDDMKNAELIWFSYCLLLPYECLGTLGK